MIFEKIESNIKDFNDFEMAYVDFNSGGYISRNKSLFDLLKLNNIEKFILKKAVFGTPIFKIGNSGNKLFLISGIHGNELSSQIASLLLIDDLLKSEIKDTIYIIPFAAPKSTMNNYRNFNFRDLNRSSYIKGSLSNRIVNEIKNLGVTAVGDFHTTAIKSNPGKEAIFCSKEPSKESFIMANYISRDVGSEIINFPVAGKPYKGAIEDECNLNNIPAITCEVLSPFGSIGEGSVERSLAQMKSFLSYFGI